MLINDYINKWSLTPIVNIQSLFFGYPDIFITNEPELYAECVKDMWVNPEQLLCFKDFYNVVEHGNEFGLKTTMIMDQRG